MQKSFKSEKKLIIFDMDGTLVNSSLTIAKAINYVRKNLGFEPMIEVEILKRVNDPDIDPAQHFYHAKAFDKDHEKWFTEYYSNHHDKELVLYVGIKEMLLTLKEQGYKLAVATNAYRNSTLQSLSHLSILDIFDTIGCYDDVPQGKPHPDMLYKVLDELGMDSNESLFIGDGPRDEMASKSANIDYIMVDWGFTEHEDAVRSVLELETILSTLQ